MIQVIPGNTNRGAKALLNISIDPTLDGFVSSITLESKAGRKAMARALRKWARWAKSQMVKPLARRFKVTQKAIKPRVQISKIKEGDTLADLWVGLDPIPVHLLGKPRQINKGTKLRKELFKGAFFAAVYGDEKKVWRRKFTGSGSSNRGPQEAGLRGRFPVILQKMEIKDVALAGVRRIEKKSPDRLATLLKQELEFALFVEPGKKRAR